MLPLCVSAGAKKQGKILDISLLINPISVLTSFKFVLERFLVTYIQSALTRHPNVYLL